LSGSKEHTVGPEDASGSSGLEVILASASQSKIKLAEAHSTLLVSLKIILGIITVAVLFFFGIIFAIAASAENTVTRLVTAVFLFAASFIVIYYVARQPKTVTQRLEVSGEMKAVQLKCPNCGASVDANRIKIVSAVPYATCPYCGHAFEVTEEPKW
jgi:DNA-directed RNA polymerase subunit RPC12/RpoP